jgi:hypothetical protein
MRRQHAEREHGVGRLGLGQQELHQQVCLHLQAQP